MTGGIKDTNTVKKKFGSRLTEARLNVGYSRQKAVDKLSASSLAPTFEKRPLLGIETYKKWERGENPVELEWIPAICEVFRCDEGFLFGMYAERKREVADIVEITGLSEPAANHLKNMWARIQKEEASGWKSSLDRQELAAIDTLLMYGSGGTILINIFQYLFCDYNAFSLTTVVDGTGERDIFDKDVLLCNNGNASEGAIVAAEKMQAIFLLQAQEELARLRYILHKQRD